MTEVALAAVALASWWTARVYYVARGRTALDAERLTQIAELRALSRVLAEGVQPALERVGADAPTIVATRATYNTQAAAERRMES